jgi:ferredoxin
MSIRFIESRTQKVHETSHCLQGLNLLGHAQLIELEIGSRCGGKGRCGKDRVRIDITQQQSLNPPTEIERLQFSREALEEGWRLACQAFPNQDELTLDVYFAGGEAGE